MTGFIKRSSGSGDNKYSTTHTCYCIVCSGSFRFAFGEEKLKLRKGKRWEWGFNKKKRTSSQGKLICVSTKGTPRDRGVN